MSEAASGLEATLTHVLHPTDFSAASERAFAHALRIALEARAGLTLFHAEREGDEAHWSEFPAVRSTLERWKLLPPGSKRDAVAALGVGVEKVRAPAGSPVEAILAYQREDPADLIVLASQAYDGFERWRRPSVAEPVARGSHAATLFLPQDARGFVSLEDGSVQLRRIVIPVDAEPKPQAALAMAALLARSLGAAPQLTLLHVGSPSDFPRLREPRGAADRVDRRSAEGAVVDAIVAAVRDLDADLLVMATRGRDGFLDALRGSTTERVLRRAGCALLAIPER